MPLRRMILNEFLRTIGCRILLGAILPALILLTKGYRTVGWRPLDMPSNWISLNARPGYK